MVIYKTLIEKNICTQTTYDELMQLFYLRPLEVDSLITDKTIYKGYIFSNYVFDVSHLLLKSDFESIHESEVEKKILNIKSNNGRVWVCGDQHIPFDLDNALSWNKKMVDEYDCGNVVFNGDLLDMYNFSQFLKNPDGEGAKRELELVRNKLEGWYNTFPIAHWNFGNHEVRIFKQLLRAGISLELVKPLRELLNIPKTWTLGLSVEIDGVYITHEGGGGLYPSINYAKKMFQSSVLSHIHSVSFVYYFNTTAGNEVFALSLGGQCNDRADGLKYSQKMPLKTIPTGACIINGKEVILRKM